MNLEPEVRLADQGGGLERLAGLLLRQSLGRQFAQLIVDQRQQPAGGVWVALVHGAQEPGDSLINPDVNGAGEGSLAACLTRGVL
jgi:hypothetical protein